MKGREGGREGRRKRGGRKKGERFLSSSISEEDITMGPGGGDR